MEDLIGGAWLAREYRLGLTQALATTSLIGGRRTTYGAQDGLTRETYVEAMRPPASLRGHLSFHLKHEVPSLQLLSRLFAEIDRRELESWITDEPTGQYARRACFLFEWLTGARLDVGDVPYGNYVDALDADRVVVANARCAQRERRFRVRDNMPGTRQFCPLVRKCEPVLAAMAVDVNALLADLQDEFGEELLMRSAVWMTLRESKSSFAIEGEGDRLSRIQRFAAVMGRRTGRGAVPLAHDELAQLQGEILGERTTLQALGIRHSPVFVGEFLRYQEMVHYIAPPAADVPAMLHGLQIFLERTEGQSPLLRAAVAAFGFVYIHPMADGNGRVHRFLVNDLLRRDGAVPDPLIIPISSVITADHGERRAYDRILEEVSRPLMQALSDNYSFGANVTYTDGISSNLHLYDTSRAVPLWRMPDLSAHVVYLAQIVGRTIREEMRQESKYLRSHFQARAAIKDVVEMPDAQIDRVIRSLEVNQGKLTNSLAKEIPVLARDGVWEEIQEAVRAAFEDRPDSDTVRRYEQRPRNTP